MLLAEKRQLDEKVLVTMILKVVIMMLVMEMVMGILIWEQVEKIVLLVEASQLVERKLQVEEEK